MLSFEICSDKAGENNPTCKKIERQRNYLMELKLSFFRLKY